jgi:sugar phosphate isomerase/epimerase
MNKNTRRSFIKKTLAASGALALKGPLLASDFLATTNTQRPIHAFTKCLQFLSYEEMAALLAKLGFDGADLTVRPGGQILPENVKRDLPKAHNLLRKSGIACDMIATHLNDPDQTDLRPILKTMASLEIRHYRMGYLAYDNRKTMPENLDKYKRTFEKLEKINRVYGVTANYQNHVGTNVGGPVWDLYTLLKDCDPRYIGVQYDIRHATVEGSLSWPTGMKLLTPWINTTVIKDFFWNKNSEGKWVVKNVPVGEGMVDFDKYFEMYKALKISGPISIHYEYDLGGAEHGNNETTMPMDKIESYLSQDLTFLRKKLQEYKLK